LLHQVYRNSRLRGRTEPGSIKTFVILTLSLPKGRNLSISYLLLLLLVLCPASDAFLCL